MPDEAPKAREGVGLESPQQDRRCAGVGRGAERFHRRGGESTKVLNPYESVNKSMQAILIIQQINVQIHGTSSERVRTFIKLYAKVLLFYRICDYTKNKCINQCKTY